MRKSDWRVVAVAVGGGVAKRAMLLGRSRFWGLNATRLKPLPEAAMPQKGQSEELGIALFATPPPTNNHNSKHSVQAFKRRV